MPADDDLPLAPPAAPGPRPGPREAFPDRPRARRDEPTPGDEGPPPSRALAACSVIGCLAVALIGAVGLLAYIGLTLLNHVNEQKQQKGAAVDGPPAAVAAADRPGGGGSPGRA